MIEIYNREGVAAYVQAEDIKAITPAQGSSMWHGTYSYVRLSDGKTIESCQAADVLRKAVEEAEGKKRDEMLKSLGAIHDATVRYLSDIHGTLREMHSVLHAIDSNTHDGAEHVEAMRRNG